MSEEGTIVTYIPDPAKPFRYTPEQQARLDAMTDEELHANALSDPDNPPLTEEDFEAMYWRRRIKEMRKRLGLNRKEFAARYNLPLDQFRRWDLGLEVPDPGHQKVLRFIAADPEFAQRVLAA